MHAGGVYNDARALVNDKLQVRAAGQMLARDF